MLVLQPATPTTIVTDDWIVPAPGLRPFQNADGVAWYSEYQFSSMHPGTVSFGFCDGSVHALNKSISNEVLGQLASCKGGEVVEEY